MVTGGTIGNDMDFVEQLYAHGAQGSFDAVGVHTDTACLTDGPDVIYRDERGRVGRYTFRALDAGIPAAPCGGVVDASGPQIEIAQPLEGLKFVDMIDIDAKGVDSAGGVGIARIKMYADGKFERTFGDGHARISPWWPSRYWKRGRHTITFKAVDEAGNVAAKSVTVRTVRRLATAAKLSLERLDASTVRVTGAVRARASAKLGGRAIVAFGKRARGKWKTVHRIRRRASRPIAVTQRVKPGAWRVFLRYPGRAGFKKSRSKPLRFEVA